MPHCLKMPGTNWRFLSDCPERGGETESAAAAELVLANSENRRRPQPYPPRALVAPSRIDPHAYKNHTFPRNSSAGDGRLPAQVLVRQGLLDLGSAHVARVGRHDLHTWVCPDRRGCHLGGNVRGRRRWQFQASTIGAMTRAGRAQDGTGLSPPPGVGGVKRHGRARAGFRRRNRAVFCFVFNGIW